MTRLFAILSLLLLATSNYAQKTVFKGQPVKAGNYPELEAQFTSYDVYQLNMPSFNTFVKDAGPAMDFTLQMGKHDWDIWLTPKDIRSENFFSRILTADGVKVLPKGENTTFRGLLKTTGGGAVALTIDKDFLYGFVKKDSEMYFIEPLWYFVPGKPKNLYVVYAASNVIPKPGLTCGLTEMEEYMDKHGHDDDVVTDDPTAEKTGNCYILELAIASDLLMYNKYGSSAAVQAHNVGVMNNVQTNYDNEFSDDIQFLIVTQFVVVPPATDPWSPSTNPVTLLNSFTSWGPSNFGVVHDLGQLWTNRDFDGGTVGIAWLSSVCTSTRYHCLQDFTSNANFLRVMTAHEIGHNFSAQHDGSGSPTIMAPSVNNTNTWSAASINSINNHIAQIAPPNGCLSFCATMQAPVANFAGTPTTGCTPMVVSFSDQSTNSPTTWNWTFPGGTPASSTMQNPTVTYNTPGTYNVTLTAANGVGSNTITKTNYITASTMPTANFNWAQIGLTVIFTNTSSANATSFLWNFGDGTTSTMANPLHTYALDGIYVVTLTATNACGSIPFSAAIPVFTPPTANFSATPTSGCTPMQVAFSNQSTPNVTSWSWSFPGGTPATSTAPNPSITYNSAGTYSVTLTVSNPAGTSTSTKTNYINVGSAPSPGFTFSISGNTVTFTNSSTNANTYSWNFGDGTPLSNQVNPSHTYATNGTFNVTLTANNACGPATVSHSVTILLPPTANFSANTTSGCVPLQVAFINSSSANSTSYAWSFPGGTPSSSTAQNPTVVYNTAGTYSVTLVSTNSAGSNTLTLTNYITVNPQPTAGFSNSVNGTTATFTNSSANATSYSWDFGDGQTGTETNPVHTYAGDGTYTVILSATNNCGTVTSTQTVVIVTPPTAGFSANTTTGCVPFTVQFINGSSANAVSYNWSFPGGTPASSNAQNPAVTYNAIGSYTVTLTVTNAAGTNTSTQTNYITVTTTPSAGFTSSTSGATVSFTNTSTNPAGASAISYSWNFGDGSPVSTQTNPTHTYANDGTWTVTLSATNGCGTSTTTKTITIITPPTAGFSANATAGCAPLTVQFTNESSENATSFEWSFPGGNPGSSTEENPTVTYNTAGSYTVTLIATNSVGSNTSTKTSYIVVSTVPAPTFTVSSNVFVATFTNTTANGTSCEWEFGDGETSTEKNPVHTYAGDGTYEVTLTATNSCGISTTTQTVVITSLPQAGFSANSTTGCVPFTVQFSDQSSSNVTEWNWSFPGGTPSSSTAQNPAVTYNSTGTYSVELTVSNSLGNNTVTQTNYITVGTTPVPGFTSSTSLLTATFTNTSTGAASYAWDFGDNATSTGANPVHTYAEDGVYTVTLTATNGCGSKTTTHTVTIVTPPTAGFSAGVTSGCTPLTVQFTNESSENAVSYNWTFQGGTPSSSTVENPVVVYNTAGNYTVTLTVTNAAGSSTSTQTDYIVVSTTPNASFTSSVDDFTATFTNTTTNADSYSWNFGDNETGTEENPVHTYAEDGVYTVILTATNGCGSVTVTHVVTVVTPPTAGFSAVVTNGCAPLTVEFVNESSENATSFEWQFPGGSPATSTAENPVVIYNAAGSYSVTLKVSNAAGSDSYEIISYISVGAPPVSGFTYMVVDKTATFTNTSIGATSYQWKFGDGNTSSDENPVHNYTEDGIYTVTLIATNECGSVTITKTVVVGALAPVALFQAENTAGCQPLSVSFENLSSSNATFFNWSFPGGTPSTSTQTNPVVAYNTPGTYDVTLIAGNLVGNDTFTQVGYIIVKPVAQASFTASANSGTVTFTNTSQFATTYEWTFGDGQSSTEENPAHTYSASGEYTVTLTAFNDCGFMSSTQTVIVVLTSIEDIPGIELFNVFPNPNSGNFTLTIKGQPLTALDLNFTNILGQRLLTEKADFRSGEFTKQFTFDQLPAGMYIFQVKAGDKALYKKVVVE